MSVGVLFFCSVLRILRDPLRRKLRSRTMFGFKDKEELMPLQQLPERPLSVLSDAFESFEGLHMIHIEAGVDTGNCSVRRDIVT